MNKRATNEEIEEFKSKFLTQADEVIKTKRFEIISKIPFGWNIYYKISDLKSLIVSFFQKIRYGASDRECYDLNRKIAKFTLKKLLHFKKMEKYNFPPYIGENSETKGSEEAWGEILDEMIFAFDYTCYPFKYNQMPETESGRLSRSPKEWEDYALREADLERRQSEGLKLFAKHFNSLWI